MHTRLFIIFLFIVSFISTGYSQIIPAKNDSLRNGKSKLNSENNIPENKDKLKYVPGEIIIKYHLISQRKEVPGSQLLSEYEDIKNIIETSGEKKISGYKSVYSTITDKMINYEKTEKQVKEELLSGNGLKKSNFINNNPFIRNDYSRIITIRFEDAGRDPVQLANEVNNITELREAGYIIDYAEPNTIYYTNYSVNDPLYTQQWSLSKTMAEQAWNIERGNKNIKIGVIDTGIDYLHEDLSDNYVSSLSYDFVDVDTLDYKSQSYYPITGEDYVKPDADPIDFNGHGTHCAGIIGANANNGRGVSGVIHNCSLIALRAGFSMLNNNTEYGLLESDDVANAIIYAVSSGVNILSMSFSGSGSVTEEDALKTASANGIVLIAAAGNDYSSVVKYPAGYDNVISVAATTSYDSKADFSNYGNWVDVAAPGEYIYSTVPKKGGAIADITGYKVLSGTSMAAPFVAGMAGLILSKNPELTPDQVKYAIWKSVDIPAETKSYIGHGRVNLLKALELTEIKTLNLNAEITTPSDGELVTNDLQIKGSAEGDTYILSYGKGVYPSSWTQIGMGTHAINDVLGTIPAGSINDGLYTLKLAAWNSQAENEIRINFREANLKDSHHGFPITLNSSTNNYTICDLEGDGKKEIVGLSGFTESSGSYANLFAYNSDGEMLKGFPVRLPFRAEFFQSPKVADIDNDGKNEIITFSLKSEMGFNNTTGYVTAFSTTGELKKGFPVLISGGIESRYSAIADIDLDGYLDIIAGTEKGIYAIKYDGSFLPGWPVLFQPNYIVRSPIVITNIDKDPQLEVLCTAFNATLSGSHYLTAYNYDGTSVEGFPVAQDAWGLTLAAGDLNRDGIMEIMTQDHRISADGKILPWAFSSLNCFSDYTIGNINDDPELEVIWGDGNNRAYNTNSTGINIPGWPKERSGCVADGTHLIADITGDEKPDILIGWKSGMDNEKTGISVYNADGSMAPGFPRLDGAMNFYNAAVADIDNDGLIELIGNDENKIFAFDLDKPYNAKSMEWPMKRNNPWETCAYPVIDSSTLYQSRGVTAKEDDTLFVRLSPSYVNWDKYYVDVKGDNPLFALSVYDGILKIIPPQNWYGKTNIAVTMRSGSNIIDTMSVAVQFMPVNDAPRFATLIPDVSIMEDDLGAIILNNLSQYITDPDENDHVRFSASALGTGIDSLIIGSFNSTAKMNNKSIPVIKRSIKEKAGISAVNRKSELSADKFGLGKFSAGNRISTKDSIMLCLVAYPKENFYGSVKIILNATDDSSAVVSDTLLLTINSINDKPQIDLIKDYTINEDDSLSVGLSYSDPDNDSLTVSSVSVPDSVSIIIKGKKANIKPHKDWNGSSHISIIVSDGIETDTASFKLIVLPVNDKPMEFALLSPGNNNCEVVNGMNGNVTFQWQKAYDADNDTVRYSFVMNDSLNVFKMANLKDTVLSLPMDGFRGWLKNGVIKAKWYVKAYDIADSSGSLNGPFGIIISDNTTSVDDLKKPTEFVLYQNYPNPFNPVTTIKYGLDKPSYVKLTVYNILGEVVTRLVDEYEEAGFYTVKWNPVERNMTPVSSGIYFYKIEAEDKTEFRKMIFLK